MDKTKPKKKKLPPKPLKGAKAAMVKRGLC